MAVEPTTCPPLEPVSWRLALGISVGAHLAVAGVLLFGFEWVTPPKPAALTTAMAVQILPMPAAPAAPAHQTSPEPQKPQLRPAPSVQKQDLPPIPQVPNVTGNVAAALKQPPSPPQQPPPPPPPAAQAAPARTAAAPAQGTPTQGVASTERNYDAQILARLEREKRYPREAMRQHMEDVVYLHMVIDRTGRIISSDIVRSRHFELLDGSVWDLVRKVNPLPRMPKELPGDTYSVTVPIDFFINKRR